MAFNLRKLVYSELQKSCNSFWVFDILWVKTKSHISLILSLRNIYQTEILEYFLIKFEKKYNINKKHYKKRWVYFFTKNDVGTTLEGFN